jgi:EAL domain-containing protein (putative c-di-GMP-specific phosphodiesterase class I)/CheY-like chemotaxis protein/GGDEF domain-containing protein
MSSSVREAPLILVVDPNEARRAGLVSRLVDAGYLVTQVEDGAGCVESAQRLRPDLVLLNAGLPDGGGIAVCRALGGAAADGAIPILLMIDPSQQACIREAREAGVSEFLERPIPLGLLEHRVRRALHHRRLALGSAATPERESESAGEAAIRAHPAELVGDRAAFLRLVAEALPGASDARHVAILCVRVDHDAPTQPTASSEGLEDVLDAAVLDSLTIASCELAEGSVRELVDGELRMARMDRRTFAFLAPRIRRPEDALTLGSKIGAHLAQVRTRGSIGIATYPGDAKNAAGLLERAEAACYCAQRNARGNLLMYVDSMSRWVPERQLLERGLRDALHNQELAVHYQPRVKVPSRRIVGMEALVRWHHPTLGLISPAQFIPLAEESGLITPIGEWVLTEACHRNRRWQELGLPPVRVSVNLSAVQFRKADLYETVCRILKETGLPSESLELELTESLLMSDPKAAIATLRRLKGAGIHLSIDDFGTGYSSLSYLKRFPIDALKIDQSFVRDVTTNPDDAAITTAIILLGHSLKLNVVAEGVESESQLSFLQVLRCNEVQGFLFGRPVPADQAEAILEGQVAVVGAV